MTARYIGRPHPLCGACFALAFAAGIAVTGSVAAQSLYFLVLVYLVRAVGNSNASTWFLLRTAVPLVLVYTLFSTLWSPPQGDVWWRGPQLAWLGEPVLSGGGLRNALLRAVRLWDLLLLFTVVGSMTSTDELVHWFGRRFQRVALTLSMITSFIPRLLAERARIAELVRMRGAVSGRQPLALRLRAAAVIYQALLANALERSLTLAESMHVRGYGAGPRTVYSLVRWRAADGWVTGACCLVVLQAAFMVTQGVLPAVATWVVQVVTWALPIELATIGVWLGVMWRGTNRTIRSGVPVSGEPALGD